MPSRVNNAAPGSRFELPALNLNFGNITDGTDIPPPPASPVHKDGQISEKPIVPPKDHDKENTKPANVAVKATATNGKLAGTKRLADEIPPSPTASTRPGSLRRLLSRTKLNNSFAEAHLSTNGSVTSPTAARPPSQSGGSFLDDGRSKRNSGWFRRLRGDQTSKRSSFAIDNGSSTNLSPKRPSGPPPPTIPELATFEKEQGGFGNDLFKDIK